MDAVVLASHLPGEGHYRSRRFRVAGIECRYDFSYWEGLAYRWGSGRTLVCVEHDMGVTDEHVGELINCPSPLCSFAYHAHWASTGLSQDVIAAGPAEGEYLQGGEEWAAWSAIGLVKITARARHLPLRREPWQRVERAVHDAVMRPWHMHGNTIGGADLLPHHHW